MTKLTLIVMYALLVIRKGSPFGQVQNISDESYRILNTEESPKFLIKTASGPLGDDLPVEHVDRKWPRKSLNLESHLEGFNEEDESLPIFDGKSGMVEFVNDLLPVESRLHFVNNLKKNCNKPLKSAQLLPSENTIKRSFAAASEQKVSYIDRLLQMMPSWSSLEKALIG